MVVQWQNWWNFYKLKTNLIESLRALESLGDLLSFRLSSKIKTMANYEREDKYNLEMIEQLKYHYR